MRVLVTGGAGFVGGSLSVALSKKYPDWEIVAVDNLKRRGSELNLSRLQEAGVRFIHADVRVVNDLASLESFGAIVECSAEPSALAGVDGGTDYVVQTNLVGAYNVFELARRHGAQVIFLSTSRVYPVALLNTVSYGQTEARFELAAEQELRGVTQAGISEAFPLEGARTLYGATKLAGELLAIEYAEAFDLPVAIDRCGVIAGPWQMGKVDQGVFAHWMLSHYFNRDLHYIGYGGQGKQVRDLLHVGDLVELIEDQLLRPDHWRGVTVNVGGGNACSLSLREATTICRDLTGNSVAITGVTQARPGDVPIYVSDCSRLQKHTDWRPRHTPQQIFQDLFEWIRANDRMLAAVLEWG